MLELDRRRRELIPRVEGLKAEQNEASGAIAAARRAGDPAEEAISRMREVAARAKALGEELSGVDAALERALAALPNLPDPTAAPLDEVLREVGEAGRTKQNISTLSNWWTRKIPRWSRPAAPASRRKHGEKPA